MAQSLTVVLSHLPPHAHNTEDEACGYFSARWGGVTAGHVTSGWVPIPGRTYFSANHSCLIYNMTSSSLSLKADETSPSHTITQSKTIRRQQ
jgi:hypothetical protein